MELALEDVLVFAFAVAIPSAAVWNTAISVLDWLFFLVWLWLFAFDAFAIWREYLDEDDEEGGNQDLLEDDDDDDEDEDEREQDKNVLLLYRNPESVVQFPCWHYGRGNARQLSLLAGFPLGVFAFILRWRVFWWLWQVSSVAGASSGSAIVDNSGVLFSAAGFFGRYTEWFPVQAANLAVYSYFEATTCTFDSDVARWGDDNGLPPAYCYPPDPTQPGYPDLSAERCETSESADCLATLRTSDYPNPAYCLEGGMFYGENRTTCGDAVLCPGSVLGPEGTIVGRSVCSYCLAYERAHNGWADPNTAYCPLYPATDPDAADNWWVCAYLCPPAALRVGVQAAQSAVTSYDVTAAWCLQRYLLGLAKDTRKHAENVRERISN